MMNELLPKLPIASWIDAFIDWLVINFEFLFDGITIGLEGLVDGIVNGLGFIPVIFLIIIVSLIAWKVCNWKIGLFTLIGLFLIDNLGYWENMLETVALVLTAVVIAIIMVDKVWKKGVRKDLYEFEEDWHQSFIDFFSIKWRSGVSVNMNAIEKSLSELNQLLTLKETSEEIKEQATIDIIKLQKALDYYKWLNHFIDALDSHEIFKYIPKEK